MTPEERRAIEWECARLIAHYANLNDAGRWEDVAALFAEDGVMTRPSAPDSPIRGRQTILDALRARPPRVTRHFCSNIVIHVDAADEARGESAMLLFTEGTSPLVGSFDDQFVLTDQGWRFAARHGRLSW